MSTTYEARQRRRTALSDAEKIDRHVDWHATAPIELRQAAGRKQWQAEWKAWTARLTRPNRNKLPRLFRAAQSPLTLASFGPKEAIDSIELVDLLWHVARGKRRAAKSALKLLPAWLADSNVASSAVYARECLAWCHAMPQLAERATAELWWSLLWHLLDATADARRGGPSVDSLLAVLAGIELPLTLAVLFPEIDNCRRAGEPAAGLLEELLVEQGQDEKLFSLEQLHNLQPTLACWTRSRMLTSRCRRMSKAELQKGDALNRGARQAFRRVLLGSMRWMTDDGRQLLTGNDNDMGQTASGSAANQTGTLLESAVKLDGSGTSRRAWRAFRNLKPARRDRDKQLTCAGAPYEASCTAVLRSSWAPAAMALATAFGTPELQLELVHGKQGIFCGPWAFEIFLDGRPLAVPRVPWDLVCWETNRRAQWLEIELNLADGVRIERGMLLAPQDEFVLLMDAVIGPEGQDVQYVGRLPLANGVRAEEGAETREVALRGDKAIGRMLPLALNEWRSDPRVGQLSVANGALELRQQSHAGALCAPLFIDYSRRRRKAPLTWRQLTVGEERQRVPRDVAAGYRVQIGQQQWLVYRALRSVANRTVLGQNLATELKVGQFLANGDVKTLIEIE